MRHRRIAPLFASAVTTNTLALSDNSGLVRRALASYDEVANSPDHELAHLRHIPGGRPSSVNARFFQLQWAHFSEGDDNSPASKLAQSSEFEELVGIMREEASEFLQFHGASKESAQAQAAGRMFVWASVHGSGSCHPPHVHSDSAVTGTYYACSPPGASPLILDDPRGKTPQDILVNRRKTRDSALNYMCCR